MYINPKRFITGNFATKRAAENAAVRQMYDARTPWLRNQNASAVAVVRASHDNTTYSVVVRNPNSWVQDRDGSNREYEILAHCGHKHQTQVAAERCMNKLTRSWCLCGHTSASYAPWYMAQVETDDGEQITVSVA